MADVNGLSLSNNNQVKGITITPGTVFKRYVEKAKDFRELEIIESDQGKGFNNLKGYVAPISEGEIIKGVILKENQIFGIISGKEEFNEVEGKVAQKEVDVIPAKEEFNEVEGKS